MSAKLPKKHLMTNLPNINRSVSLFTRQRQAQPAETLMKAGVVLVPHQSEFALYFVRTLHQYNTWLYQLHSLVVYRHNYDCYFLLWNNKYISRIAANVKCVLSTPVVLSARLSD